MNSAPLFFLHFPRTAGTTIDDIFFNNYPKENILKIYSKEEFEKYRYLDEESFSKIQFITGHLLLDNLNPPQIYGKNVRAFTFLRDPVKRLFSEYIFLKTWENQHLYEYLNKNNISFSEYVRSDEKILKYRGKNFMTRCLSGDSLEHGNLSDSLAKAKYNLENNFIFFGIQEKFMESLLLLSKKINLKNIFHQKRNSLNYGVINSKITEAEQQLALEYNEADLELYNFALNLFNKRITDMGSSFQASLKKYTLINSKFQNISNLLYKKANAANTPLRIELSKDSKW